MPRPLIIKPEHKFPWEKEKRTLAGTLKYSRDRGNSKLYITVFQSFQYGSGWQNETTIGYEVRAEDAEHGPPDEKGWRKVLNNSTFSIPFVYVVDDGRRNYPVRAARYLGLERTALNEAIKLSKEAKREGFSSDINGKPVSEAEETLRKYDEILKLLRGTTIDGFHVEKARESGWEIFWDILEASRPYPRGTNNFFEEMDKATEPQLVEA
ncbi:MAG TPA: hypothetical protein VI933_00695 [archaeon]|nr:hypothetical protein [archaeon]